MLTSQKNGHLQQEASVENDSTIEGRALLFSFNAGGAKGAFMHGKIKASAKVESISDSIESVIDQIVEFMIKNSTDDLKYQQNDFRTLIDQYLATEVWQLNLALWGSLGLYYRKEDRDQPKMNKVSILIKRDSDNNACALFIALKSPLMKTSISIDINEFKKILPIFKEGITLKDVKELDKEADSLSDKLQNATNPQRIDILNEFNRNWQGKFSVTYTVKSPENEGLCQVVTSKGTPVYNSKRYPVASYSQNELPALGNASSKKAKF